MIAIGSQSAHGANFFASFYYLCHLPLGAYVSKGPHKWPRETRERAKHLIVQDGLSLSAVSARIGVPEGTVKRWAAAERWTQIRDGEGHYGATVAEMKQNLLNLATDGLKGGETQAADLIELWCKVERTYPERHYAEETLSREMAIHALDSFVSHLMKQDADPAHIDWLRRAIALWVGGLEQDG